jgi:DNA polymerase V
MSAGSSDVDLALSSPLFIRKALPMSTRKPINIPVVSATAQQDTSSGSGCSETELVALMVLGDSMAPEFIDGEILVIETGVTPIDGWFVIATVNEEFIFRQLKRDDQGGWLLHALNPAYPDVSIAGLDGIKGVVTHKRKPGSRKSVKYYVPLAGP